MTSDRYAGQWPVARWKAHGITCDPAALNRSELYLALLPLVNARRAELLDDERLVAPQMTLERRTSRGGRDSIDHAPGAHDDRANAVAGALVLADAPMREPRIRVLFDDEEWADHQRDLRGRASSFASNW